MKIVKLISAFVFAAAILFLISCPIVNNISAEGIIRDILSLPLPEKTDVIVVTVSL